MARRGNRGEQYLAVAAFYGTLLVQDLQDPNVPDFVIVREARLAGHYAVAALGGGQRKSRTAGGAGAGKPASLLNSRRASVLARLEAASAIGDSSPS